MMRLLMIGNYRLCVMLIVAWVTLAVRPAGAQEYKVAKIDSAAPADKIAPEISALLAPNGFKVTKGTSTLCEIWLAREWPIAADATTGGEILYLVTPGQLIGAIRYARKGADLRDQP